MNFSPRSCDSSSPGSRCSAAAGRSKRRKRFAGKRVVRRSGRVPAQRVMAFRMSLSHPLNARTPERLPLDCLEQLRDCSLVQVEERGEEVRYRLLETLREYAWEQLAASGELAVVRNRHYDWYLQLALRAEAAAFGPEQKGW